ncbi:MAG: C10 family peptidase, partial [Allomuricauda sp.]
GTAVNMDYACDGSGAQTESGVTALKNTFGYSSASFGGVNYTTIENEIKFGRPVGMAGHKVKDCFLWWCGYKDGHAWVCEGYSVYGTCYSVSTHYYMNWGWNGLYNGSYANNGDTNYKYNKRMLYNIKP